MSSTRHRSAIRLGKAEVAAAASRERCLRKGLDPNHRVYGFPESCASGILRGMLLPRLRLTAIAGAALLSAAAAPALAQSGDWVGPPADVQKAPHDQTQDLDFLFGALKVAPDDVSAKEIEQRIWSHWLVSSSDTSNLLMSRVKTAVDDKDLELALRLLDAVVELDPGYVEGWNRRATVHYMRKEFGQSLTDIRRVLALEPRHFGALTGLGLILQDIGEEKEALAAFRKALAVNPHLDKVQEMAKTLSEKIDGRDI
jgi:tetratricopeptide (TPR) repeat protein